MRPRRRRSLFGGSSGNLMFLVLLGLVALGLRFREPAPQSGDFIAIDGDSLRKAGQDYRLHAIDAPELHQTCRDAGGAEYPCGREAREALRGLVSGKTLACRIIETDRYRRLVATCKADGTDINREMVRLGWAIAYRQHGTDYVGAESEAHAARRGIWQGTFTRPEDWRRAQRDKMVKGSVADGGEPD